MRISNATHTFSVNSKYIYLTTLTHIQIRFVDPLHYVFHDTCLYMILRYNQSSNDKARNRMKAFFDNVFK